MLLNKKKIINILLIISFCFITKSSLVFAEDDVADLKQYLLGTGDMIRIQVYNEKDLYLEARVSDTGIISYPFLGELKVKGMGLKLDYAWRRWSKFSIGYQYEENDSTESTFGYKRNVFNFTVNLAL